MDNMNYGTLFSLCLARKPDSILNTSSIAWGVRFSDLHAYRADSGDDEPDNLVTRDDWYED
ncbi:hypothetical protein U9M48_000493 [Paspalum notatum var. saurae]|uniref:Uncharacterized protein n=1 Tax=Paspalum notatum var. saurae TaxID=547442 RepID=A0AAQ3SG00_PASNO